MKRYNELTEKFKNNYSEIKTLWSDDFENHYALNLDEYLDDMEDDFDWEYVWGDDFVTDIDQNLTLDVAIDILGVDFDNQDDADWFSDYGNEISNVGNDLMFNLIEEKYRKYTNKV